MKSESHFSSSLWRVTVPLGATLAAALLLGCGPAGSSEPLAQTELTHLEGSQTYTVDVWADNWFALYLGEELVIEDSVSITTERSFNAESFTFRADPPLQLNFIAKDFKENDSGLEYIGSRRQQMGDGGFIAQVRDSGGTVVAVTDDRVRCVVIHRAPLDKGCEKSEDPDTECSAEISAEPAGWKAPNFDDSGWPQAIVHTESAVDPKGGYDQIDWAPDARLIWSEDLESDNTLLCRLSVG